MNARRKPLRAGETVFVASGWGVAWRVAFVERLHPDLSQVLYPDGGYGVVRRARVFRSAADARNYRGPA